MKIPVLDHGYVEFVEAWGTGSQSTLDYERGIIEAARQSTQGSFRGWEEGDNKLLGTLFNSKPQHATPFEFAGLVIEVQAPIHVFREWHRHRTQSYNEASARYAPLPELYYLPQREVVLERGQAATRNKQAQGVRPFNPEYVGTWLANVEHLYAAAEGLYQEALSQGIPKELARITMPVGHYSRMRASANLRNWLAFLTLRADEAAMWEIRQFADAVETIVRAYFPHTWWLFRHEA